jgi:hypothetical protein
MALFREVQRAIRAELGGEVDDDLVLHEIVRRARGGAEDEGRAPYQVAVTKCPTCELVAIDGGGETHPVDAVVEEMIACDRQVIPQLGDLGAPAPLHAVAETAKGMAVDHTRDIPQVGHAREFPQLGRAHEIPQVGRGRAPAAVSAAARVGAVATRATQTIPPRTRREVLRREGACAVPGCRNSRYRQVHHVKPRSEGGNHHPTKLVALCHSHHSAVHLGTLVIRGDANAGFAFHHADGAAYGSFVDPAAIELATQAFDALCGMGFKMTQARQLIDSVQEAGAPSTLEAFLSAALRAT